MTTWFESGSEPALVPGFVFSASVLDLSSALLFPSSLSSAEQNRDMLVSERRQCCLWKAYGPAVCLKRTTTIVQLVQTAEVLWSGGCASQLLLCRCNDFLLVINHAKVSHPREQQACSTCSTTCVVHKVVCSRHTELQRHLMFQGTVYSYGLW